MAEKMEIKTSTVSGLSNESKLWAALCYVFPVLMFILVYVMEDKKKDKFVFFHAWQSLLLGIVCWALAMVIATVTFGIGIVCFPVLIIVFLYFAYRAYQGEKFLLPVVGEYAEKQMK
ncbi:MAG: hypothetical protein V1827_03715 [Candidatus Micrarchaeota archaeon]